MAARFPLPLVSALCMALTACAAVPPAAQSQIAFARLVDADGTTVGTASFYSQGDGLVVTLTARGLTPGNHGVHIHAVGTCDAPGFASAGPHLNLAHRAHGYDNPAGYHEGDLPNLTAGADGRGVLTARLPGTAASIAPAFQDGDGSAIVIHADADDMKTDPSGNSGTRIVCGRIEFPIRP